MRRASDLLLALVALAALAIAALPDPRAQTAVEPLLSASATGGLRVTNSREGHPVIRVAGAEPGRRTAGRVRVTYHGPPGGALEMRLFPGLETTGPNGGELGSVLRLRFFHIWSNSGRRVLRRGGHLRALERVRVGRRWEPGEVRRYAFRARLPNRGTPPSVAGGDNAFQGSRARFRIVWLAAESRRVLP